MRKPALTYLAPNWFTLPMGLSGLALAWARAAETMGLPAWGASASAGVLALVSLLLLSGASLLRWQRHPQAWQEDLHHPVRHAFAAAPPVALLLVGTVIHTLATALRRELAWSSPMLDVAGEVLWMLGCGTLLPVTWWTLSRWWRGPQPGGLPWQALTPVLFIPVVGHVLAPLAGGSLGHAHWATAQFGIGLVLWLPVLTLLWVRVASQGMWPERLWPANAIFIAPPAVVGMSALQLGAPQELAWACWGVAAFMAFWTLGQARRILAQPFSMAHWGLSFPLAALTGLTLALARPGSALLALGVLLLALTTLVVLGLVMGTWHGWKAGTLLAPEPVASIQPA